MCFLGIPAFLAAAYDVDSSGRHVKIAFAPEDFSWNTSSSSEYPALAGDEIPDREWTAQLRVRVSIFHAILRQLFDSSDVDPLWILLTVFALKTQMTLSHSVP